MPNTDKYEDVYTDEGFWDKLQRFAKAAGKDVVEKALLLYYAAQEENAPAWAKATVAGALGYFILPLDAIPDLVPMTGYTDDLGVLAIAMIALATYINDNVREKARLKLEGWFGESD